MQYLFSVVIGSFILYKTYLYIYPNIEKYVIEKYILPRVQKILDDKMKEIIDTNSKDIEIKPMHQNSIQLLFKDGTKTHSLYLPYKKDLVNKMPRRKIYLIKNIDDKSEKIDISQKAGIPYLITAQDLGGEKIVLEDLTGEIIAEFEKDQIPNIF